jgi:hypothetical protein
MPSNLQAGTTLSVLPPAPGLNVANPTLGHVRNHLLAFDAWDKASGNSTIYILNLATNKMKPVAETGGGFGFPSFMGDDSAVVFSRYDPACRRSAPCFDRIWTATA